MPGRIFRMRRGGDKRQPVWIESRIWITVEVGQRNSGHRPPRHFGRNRAVPALGGPDSERGVGHRNIEYAEKAIGVGHREVVRCANLVCRLIPMYAGVAL